MSASVFNVTDIPPEGIVLPDGPVSLSLGVPMNYDGPAIIRIESVEEPPR